MKFLRGLGVLVNDLLSIKVCRSGFFWRWRGLFALTCAFFLLPAFSPAQAQGEITDLVEIEARAGYDGWFRPNVWMPVKIDVQNNGPAITGRFVIRPETSGSAIPNSFSVPVDLPAGTRQTVNMYLTARGEPQEMRLELLDTEDSVLASRPVPIRDIQPRDVLYTVITDSPTAFISLNTLNVGGYDAFQANWNITNIPDRAVGLEAVNMMLMTDVDSGTLSSAQQEALRTWITGGGHLIVTGGANWQATAAGLGDLLPLEPENSGQAEDVTPLARLGADYRADLTGNFIIAEGTLADDAQVLASLEDGRPLVARHKLGDGTVDYVTVDPGNQVLRSWINLPELWYTLVTSVDIQPSWSYGIADWGKSVSAVEIMPGVDYLPAVLSLVGFLLAYIGLIGPLNYIILSRLNRREYAWVTIPILILVFSIMAWSVGFNLRGERVTLSRLSVIQTWADADEAHLEQVIGLLAPRRGDYSLGMPDDRVLRPVSENFASTSGLSSRSLTSTNIQQTARFDAVDFPVDASFIAAFNAAGVIERPDIGGRVTLTHTDEGVQAFQGSVSNNSDFTLFQPVILVRGGVLHLQDPLEPGDVFTFDEDSLVTDGSTVANASPLEIAARTDAPFFTTTMYGFRGSMNSYQRASTTTIIDILGEDNYLERNFRVSLNDDDTTKEIRRRQALLDAFAVDQFASTTRGNRAFLVGWTSTAPTTEEVSSGDYDVVDTSIYFIELVSERDPAERGNTTTITSDQFSWISLDRTGANDIGPVDVQLNTEDEISFRYTPLPDARLDEVDHLTVIIERTRTAPTGSNIEVWNWLEEDWDIFNVGPAENLEISRPQNYIGPLNAVQLRLRQVALGSGSMVNYLGVEQQGQF